MSKYKKLAAATLALTTSLLLTSKREASFKNSFVVKYSMAQQKIKIDETDAEKLKVRKLGESAVMALAEYYKTGDRKERSKAYPLFETYSFPSRKCSEPIADEFLKFWIEQKNTNGTVAQEISNSFKAYTKKTGKESNAQTMLDFVDYHVNQKKSAALIGFPNAFLTGFEKGDLTFLFELEILNAKKVVKEEFAHKLFQAMNIPNSEFYKFAVLWVSQKNKTAAELTNADKLIVVADFLTSKIKDIEDKIARPYKDKNFAPPTQIFLEKLAELGRVIDTGRVGELEIAITKAAIAQHVLLAAEKNRDKPEFVTFEELRLLFKAPVPEVKEQKSVEKAKTKVSPQINAGQLMGYVKNYDLASVLAYSGILRKPITGKGATAQEEANEEERVKFVQMLFNAISPNADLSVTGGLDSATTGSVQALQRKMNSKLRTDATFLASVQNFFGSLAKNAGAEGINLTRSEIEKFNNPVINVDGTVDAFTLIGAVIYFNYFVESKGVPKPLNIPDLTRKMKEVNLKDSSSKPDF